MSEEHIPGANGTDTSTAPPDTGKQPDWSGFISALDKLPASLADKLGNKFDSLEGTVKSVAAPPPPPPPNYEEMSNAELVAHMTGSLTDRISKLIEEKLAGALNPLTEHLNKLQTTVITGNAKTEVAQLREKHKDFADWKDEMVALAKEHPTLGFQQVYQLARANNPAKAGELDLKYNPPPPKPPPRFGGFAPSGTAKGETPVLKGEAAGRAAYEEVMARHPGILPALQEL
jgi:hypothetical protein